MLIRPLILWWWRIQNYWHGYLLNICVKWYFFHAYILILTSYKIIDGLMSDSRFDFSFAMNRLCEFKIRVLFYLFITLHFIFLNFMQNSIIFNFRKIKLNEIGIIMFRLYYIILFSFITIQIRIVIKMLSITIRLFVFY